jgi:hypothetical protein
MSIQTEINRPVTTMRQEVRLTDGASKSRRSWENRAFVLILVLEFCFLLLRARGKLFWYDELITFHVSGLQPLSRLRYALNNGADSMSFGYYLVARLARMLPVDPLIAMRLPSILGYLMGLIGVYWFIARKLPAVAGLAAVLLMTLTSYRWYATEARSYALMVGFLAISAALWQRIGDRRFVTVLFGLALFSAVASHSLAVLTIGCFAVAEIAFTLRERQRRWGVWTAMGVAAIPFAVGFNHLAALRNLFAAHFWAHTSWSGVITAPGEYFEAGQRMTPVLVIFCLPAIAFLLKAAWGNRRASREEFTFSELALIGAFLIYPAFLIVFMKLQGAGYTPRYGLPGILGLIPVIVYICRTQSSERVFRWITAALLITFSLQLAHDFQAKGGAATRTAGERWATLARIGREQPDLPIVIANSQEFFEEFEYGPEDLRARTVNLADKDLSDRFLGSDSSEIEDLMLAQFTSIRFEAAGPFLAGQRKFVLQSEGPEGPEDWLTRYLLEKQYRLSLIGNDAAGPVYIAER